MGKFKLKYHENNQHTRTKNFKNDYFYLDKYPSICKTSLLERRNSKINFFDCLSYFGHPGLASRSFNGKKANVYYTTAGTGKKHGA